MYVMYVKEVPNWIINNIKKLQAWSEGMRFRSVERMENDVKSLFVCLFSSHSRIYHSYGDITITGESQILTYARH